MSNSSSSLNFSHWTTSTLPFCDFNESADDSNNTITLPPGDNVQTIMLVSSYAIICLVGLLGNALVILVVCWFAKMKTVTNLYIVNLAISDALFMTSLPFLITTTILRHWIFGTAMCKIYFVLFSINFFTSVFTLTALSADRYLAVCHPVRSGQYRTTNIAFFICLSIWSVSFIVMLPIILYSTTYPQSWAPGRVTCTIMWPSGQLIAASKAFTWYTFLLGFAIPVSLITVLYVSVILRLRHVGPVIKSKEKKKSHRKVTRMVLAVISVYIVCWLPYWVFQVNLTFKPFGFSLEPWQVYVFHLFTILTFANSMLNPLLYAFLSENFRRSFVKAFKCISQREFDRSGYTKDSSIFPKGKFFRNESGKNKTKQAEKFELATMLTSAAGHNQEPKNGNNVEKVANNLDENGMYVDKESQTQ